MNFFENITLSEITHASSVIFRAQEKNKMTYRQWYGMAFALDGELTYIHNAEKIPLLGNKVVFIPKGISYDVHCTKGGSFAVVNFLSPCELDYKEFVTFEVENIDNIRSKFNALQNVFKTGYSESMSLLYKIFSLIENNASGNIFPPYLVKAVEYIESNLSSPELSNTEIAENIGISEVYLRKLFSKNISLSVNRYIQNKRIEKAERLLKETLFSVTEISELCGYSCIYYFCRIFKEQTGYTPTKYRNENGYKLF